MTTEIKRRIAQIGRGEVPDGYRRTKAGIIPDDWKSAALQTLCDINPNRTGDTPSEVAFIAMSDTDEVGRIIRQHIVPYDTVCRGYTPFLRGDILVAKITPCFENGKGAYTEHLETECGFGSTEFHVLRCRPSVFGAYVFFHTQSGKFRKALQTEMTGSAGQRRVQTASIASYCIPLPPLAEQRRIGAILSAQDSVIELQERLITEKQRQKRYLMQRLLTGKQRLPGFGGEWKTIQIGKQEYTQIDPEYLSSNTSPDYQFTYITLEGVNNGRLIKTMQCEYATAPSRARKIIRKADILFGTVRPNLHSHLFVDSNDGDICSTGFCVIRCNQSKVNAKLLYYHLFSTHMEKQIDSAMVGSNYPAVSTADVKCLKVTIPVNISEQRAIADILSTADREIDLLRRKLEEEKRKKKALSQLLLTGIVRT